MWTQDNKREDYFLQGKNGLETAVILSQEQYVAFGRKPRSYDLLGKLVQVVRVFEANGIRFALIGGLAMGERAIPRATKDVDFLVDGEDMEKARHLLESYYREGNSDFMLFDIETVYVDLIAARLRFARRAVAEAELREVEGVRVPVVKSRDLLILKLIAAGDRRKSSGRLKDQSDSASLLEHAEELTAEDYRYAARVLLEAFASPPERREKYVALLRWMNEELESLGHGDWKVEL